MPLSLDRSFPSSDDASPIADDASETPSLAVFRAFFADLPAADTPSIAAPAASTTFDTVADRSASDFSSVELVPMSCVASSRCPDIFVA